MGRRRAGAGDIFFGNFRPAQSRRQFLRAIDWAQIGREPMINFVRENEWQAAQSVQFSFWVDYLRKACIFAQRG